MVVIRPIEKRDWDQLWSMAHKTGVGFTSLQANEVRVRYKLEWALESFEAEQPLKQANYLFVLEDLFAKKVVGLSAIESAIGLDEPWYNYRIIRETHNTKYFDARSEWEVLILTNEYSGVSELCTLFLLPEYRKNNNGHLLSKSRMMFLSENPERFHQKIMAEMRGVSDENGISPFWEAVGRKFFSMEFHEASLAVMDGKSFIAELVPRHPIYRHLLPKRAQAAIGKTHKHTLPAMKLLEREGMRFSNCVDIFDAGPVMESDIVDLRISIENHIFEVHISDSEKTEDTQWLIANRSIKDYRCISGRLSFDGSSRVVITYRQADLLRVASGDMLRIAPLFAQKTS